MLKNVKKPLAFVAQIIPLVEIIILICVKPIYKIQRSGAYTSLPIIFAVLSVVVLLGVFLSVKKKKRSVALIAGSIQLFSLCAVTLLMVFVLNDDFYWMGVKPYNAFGSGFYIYSILSIVGYILSHFIQNDIQNKKTYKKVILIIWDIILPLLIIASVILLFVMGPSGGGVSYTFH